MQMRHYYSTSVRREVRKGRRALLCIRVQRGKRAVRRGGEGKEDEDVRAPVRRRGEGKRGRTSCRAPVRWDMTTARPQAPWPPWTPRGRARPKCLNHLTAAASDRDHAQGRRASWEVRGRRRASSVVQPANAERALGGAVARAPCAAAQGGDVGAWDPQGAVETT